MKKLMPSQYSGTFSRKIFLRQAYNYLNVAKLTPVDLRKLFCYQVKKLITKKAIVYYAMVDYIRPNTERENSLEIDSDLVLHGKIFAKQLGAFPV